MKKIITLCFLLALVCVKGWGQTVLISPTGDGGFETGTTFALNNWIVVNGTNNTWVLGNPSGGAGVQGGARAAYIGNSTTWASTNNSTDNHFYRDVTIPTGATAITLSFYLQWPTVDDGFDFLNVYTTTTSKTPVAGTLPGNGYTQVFSQTSTALSSYTLETVSLPASLAGTTVRLVFTYVNDGGNPKGKAAVDNISLVYTPPTLSATALTAFGNVCTNTTAVNSFTITGTNLTTANITVAALTGYTYSITSTGTYTPTLSLTQPGGNQSQSIYVKFTPTAVQSYNGNIVIGGGGASSINVAASGTGVNSPPTVTAGAATGITLTSATVPGTISSTGCTPVTAYGVEYSTTNGFGNGTGTPVAGSNLSGGNFSVTLTGLTQGTTYYYHAFATNSGGTGYSTPQGTFTTLAPTLSATALTAFSAQCINGTYGPNSFTLTGSNLSGDVTVNALLGFTYSTTSGGTYTNTLTLTPTSGSINQIIYVDFTPTAVQSYNGNIVISGGGASSINVAASGNGVYSAPTVTSGTATSITALSATVSGTISATGCSAVTAYGVEYSTTNNFGNGTGTPVSASNLSGGNFSSNLTGLSPSTIYYFHAYTTNGGGTGYGSQGTFTTATPTLSVSPTTLAFGSVCTNTTAVNSFTITGTNLTTANVTVAALTGYTYSTTSGGTYTTTLSLTQPSGAFSQVIYVKFSPTAVQPYNGSITVGGGGAANKTVTITGSGVNTVPSVANGTATSITTVSATVSGTISATGCTAITAYGIEYSTTNNFGNGTGTPVSASNLSGGSFSSNLTGLTPNTAYYFHAYATNGGGTGYGSQGTFTTLPLSITTGTISGSPFCAGAPVSVPFTSVGTTYTSYTAQLSNASGSFFSAVVIGTLNTTANSGTIPATIPAGTASGTGYLIRVVSTSPAVTGSNSNAITVIALPLITSVTPASASICSGTNTTLTAAATALPAATIFTDNFDGTPSFTSAGSVTGGSSQVWGQETSGTNVNGAGTFTSPNGGKLMVAIAADLFTLGTTAATTLTSPVINTNNYSSLTLTYNHTYKQGTSGGAGTVEISTNGGSSWTVLQTYNTNQGGSTSFVSGTISLANTYLNQANLKIRFNFNSSNGASLGFVSSWWAVDDITLNGVSVSLYAWTASPSGATAGLPAGAGTFSATNNSILVAPTVSTVYTATIQNPVTTCQSTATSNSTSTITIKANTSIALSSATGTDAQTTCAGSTITPITYQITGSGTLGASITGTLPSGVTGSFNTTTNVFTISGTPDATTSGLYSYTITATGDCASPKTISGTINVNALPALVNFSSAGNLSYCTDADGTDPDGLDMSIITSQTGVNYQLLYNGSPVGSAIAGTGGSIDFGLQYTLGTYTIQGTNATTNCSRIVTNSPIFLTAKKRPQHFNVKVNGVITTAVSVCDGNSVVFGLDGSQSGATYKLILVGTPNTQIGSSITGAGAAISFPPTSITANGTYKITASNGTCGTETMDDPVTVTDLSRPTPTLITAPSGPYCSGQNSVTYTTQSGSGINTYVWTVSGTQGADYNITAGGISSTNNTVTISWLTAGSKTVTVNYNNSNGCNGVSAATSTITVNQTPVISAQTATAICSGGNFTVTPAAGGGNIIPAGTTYSWSAPTTAGITGAAGGTNQSSISGTLTNTTNSPITVVYNITATAGSCSSGFTVSVTVNPAPAITSKTATAACSGAFSVTPTNGGGDIVPVGITYSWNAPTGTGFTGGAAGSGTTINGTLTNTTDAAVTAVYTVTPTSGSCTGSSFTVTVTINAVSNITNKTTSICSGSSFAVTPVTSGSDIVPSGTTYSWSAPTYSNVNIGGGVSGSGSSITGTLTNSGTVSGTATYTVTPVPGSGCTGNASFTVTVTVNPLPTASISVASSACFGQAPQVTITGTVGNQVTYTDGTTPKTITIGAGGNYQFNATNLSVGNTTFTLTQVQNGTTCPNNNPNASATVTIYANPNATVTANSYIQIGGPVLTLTASTNGGTWSTGNSNLTLGNPSTNTIDATAVNLGTTNVFYNLSEAHGATTCSSTSTTSVNITAQFVTKVGGLFSDFNTWNIGTQTGLQASNSAIPQISNSIDVQHALQLDADYTSGSYFAITVGGTMSISPSKVFSSGGTVNFNGKAVTVRSDATGTGAIGQMATAISNATNVTVERYIPKRRAWRLMTAPVTGTTIHAAWQEGSLYNNGVNTPAVTAGRGTLITGLTQGTAANANSHGFDFWNEIANSSSSLRYYDYATSTWINYTDINTVAMNDKPAYMLFVRGDRTVTTDTGATTLRATGVLKQGNVLAAISSSNGTTALISNPYASLVDFGKVYLNNTALLQDKFIFWNSKLSTYGAYEAVVGDGDGIGYNVVPNSFTPGGADNTVRFLQSGEGFFVYPKTGASGNVSIGEAAKSTSATGGTNPYRISAATESKLYVNLNIKNSDGTSTLADGIMLRYDDSYSAGIDEDDAAKQANFYENFGISSQSSSLIIEARPSVAKTDTVQIRMWNVGKKTYQVQAKAENFTHAATLHAFLEDRYTGTRQELSLTGDVTSVDFVVNSDTASYSATRFRIVFRNEAAVLPVTLTSVKAAPANGGVNVTWIVANEVNIKQYTVERSTDGGANYASIATQAAKNSVGAATTAYQSFDALPKTGDNLYRIRIESANGTVTYSSVVKVSFGQINQNPVITMYPNPVRGNEGVQLQLSNLPAGSYLLSLYSGGGQTVYQKKITVSQNNTIQTEKVVLNGALAQGSYSVKMSDSKGKIMFTDKLIVAR